ncbi:hypothetical protein CMI47_10160 [Candidatus Pacearchaeota archaeon]|nr:hypothetical protein [Candidatus Pacearchaeota archaeon]|tara:strand:- start:6508 stop:6801 length:294 start_codon:yes stop_codon:yes gene_type:complete
MEGVHQYYLARCRQSWEKGLTALTSVWYEHLDTALVVLEGDVKGRYRLHRYVRSFPEGLDVRWDCTVDNQNATLADVWCWFEDVGGTKIEMEPQHAS